jgi:hypothetical protein
MKKILYLGMCLGLVFSFSSCERTEKARVQQGYLPLYANEVEENIKLSQPARSLANPGKIYIYQNMLFVNERGEGIHVIDNSDKTNPKKLAFYEIPGCSDMAVKGNVLYANLGYGVVALDISSVQEAKMLSYSLFPGSPNTPEPSMSVRNSKGEIVFKCADPAKGQVIGWKLGKIEGAYCTIN